MGLYNSLPTDTKVDPKKVSGTFYTKKQRAWREKAKLINGNIMTKYKPSFIEETDTTIEPSTEEFMNA